MTSSFRSAICVLIARAACSADDLQAHPAGARTDEPDLPRGPPREVDHAALVVGEAVVDADDDAAPRGQEGDAHARAELPARVGGGQRVLVEALAAGRLLAVVTRAVPGGDAGLDQADRGGL